MDAISLLRNRMAAVTANVHALADQVGAVELADPVLPGTSPVGLTLWHIPRTQDWLVNTTIRGVTEVADQPREGLPDPHRWGFGTGMTADQARAAASEVHLPALSAYADAVGEVIDDWLGSLTETDLDAVPPLMERQGVRSAYSLPAALAAVEHLEGLTIGTLLLRPGLSHPSLAHGRGRAAPTTGATHVRPLSRSEPPGLNDGDRHHAHGMPFTGTSRALPLPRTIAGSRASDDHEGREARWDKFLAAAVAVLALSGCTGSASSSSPRSHAPSGGSRSSMAELTAKAPKSCAPERFNLQQATRVSPAQASSVVAGHLPQRLPDGFGLQQVDRVEPGHLGYVAWTDDACRRVAVLYAPGVTSVNAPAVHAFGPWMKLQGCGEPRPCVVYEGGVDGGLVTFSTSGLDPAVTADLLHTVNTGSA